MRQKARSILAITAALLLSTDPAPAATRTWSGGGSDSLWSNPENWSGSLVPASGDDKTSIAFTVPHDRPGSLLGVLHELADRYGDVRLMEQLPMVTTRTPRNRSWIPRASTGGGSPLKRLTSPCVTLVLG